MDKDLKSRFAEVLGESVTEFYSGRVSAGELGRIHLPIMRGVLETIENTRHGLISPLMRIVAHYAATAPDPDKAEVLEAMHGAGGVVPLLERLGTDGGDVSILCGLLEDLEE